jgi:tetratricopeptide (TPR) repeat protein
MKMKNSIKKSTLIVGTFVLASVSIAQKKNETSAAVEFKNKYQMAIASGDMETAKKSLVNAKNFIDLAAENPETKDSPKTLWLKGEIYSSFLTVASLSKDTTFAKIAGEDALKVSIAAFKRGFEISDKFDSDIRESVYQKHDQLDVLANILYKGNMLKEAAEVYTTEAEFYSAIGETDSSSIFNSSLCYEKSNNFGLAAIGYEKLAKIGYKGPTTYALASVSYRKNGQIAEAKAVIVEGRKKHPSNRDLLLEQVNTNIEAGDAAGAESALNEAIAADPKNKQLFYTIGTIYIDLKQNEKAEMSLNKALEIDPEYIDAQYQLGAHLVTWGTETKTAANQLKFGDPNYDKMLKSADEIYKRALVPLEKYIAKNPNDKDVLNILFQINKNIGNTEKALEYKKRADALK